MVNINYLGRIMMIKIKKDKHLENLKLFLHSNFNRKNKIQTLIFMMTTIFKKKQLK